MKSPDSRRPTLHTILILLATCIVLAGRGEAVTGLTAPAPTSANEDGKRPLEFVDLMKFRQIEEPVISEDGGWIAYGLWPDRGDGEAVVRSTTGNVEYSIERGASPTISADSAWIAATVKAPLAEIEAATAGEKKEGPKNGLALLATADGSIREYERVKSFAFSEDGGWIAIHRFEQEEGEPEDEKGEKAQKGTSPGEGEGAVTEEEPEEPGETGAQKADEDGEEEEGPERVGTTLVLRHLASGEEIEIPAVESYAFEGEGRFLAYATATETGDNGLYVRSLEDGEVEGSAEPTEHAVVEGARGRYTALTWAEEAPQLGFIAAVDGEDGEPGDGSLWTWDGQSHAGIEVLPSSTAPDGWFVPSTNELTWTEDGGRLFFGLKPEEERFREHEGGGDEPGGEGSEKRPSGEQERETGTAATEEEEKGEGAAQEKEPFDPHDVEALLEERELDVWHWDDPLIVPNQKERWEQEKVRTYRAVLHVETGEVVPLADREVREVEAVENPAATLGFADVPYLKLRTWEGWFRDVYRIDLDDGSRQLVAEKLPASYFGTGTSLSPEGRYVVYYRTPHWYLFDGRTGETRNLTEGLDVPFADEDHDYPAPASGYGVADWVDGDRAVLIYDKYDVWKFPTEGGEPTMLTDGLGRREEYVFRILDLDEERDTLEPDEPLLLSAYHDRRKTRGFWTGAVDSVGARELLEGDYRLTFLAKSEEADRILYTRETYTEFPDLWTAALRVGETADSGAHGGNAGATGDDGVASGAGDTGIRDLVGPRRLSDANPRISEFAWGSAELVEWLSDDGVPHQGVLIKPGGYEEGKRYPVLVYFYRFFSQRLHEFNEPVVNHRPSFPVYASHGYAVFLPDIRFEVGRPGLAAMKSLVPGVLELVDRGIADPDAIGLHGHSWSGYQTAFIVTRTDLFAAAAAGAPVSNMTSAYSGIRWGSGLARQFQYEESQSRIGASLWERPDLYIENSPVFYADRIETPLLIQFGDRDEAVPWWQGIELYLAMRRLGKEAVFLQYRDEPHHLQKYANKLDYSIKMKQFFDHYLKGEPAPEWWTEGVPYRGN